MEHPRTAITSTRSTWSAVTAPTRSPSTSHSRVQSRHREGALDLILGLDRVDAQHCGDSHKPGQPPARGVPHGLRRHRHGPRHNPRSPELSCLREVRALPIGEHAADLIPDGRFTDMRLGPGRPWRSGLKRTIALLVSMKMRAVPPVAHPFPTSTASIGAAYCDSLILAWSRCAGKRFPG